MGFTPQQLRAAGFGDPGQQPLQFMGPAMKGHLQAEVTHVVAPPLTGTQVGAPSKPCGLY